MPNLLQSVAKIQQDLDQVKKRRQSIRLKNYAYSQNGAYFVTVCATNRECLFGDIVGGKMRLNDAGKMIQHWWLELGNKFPTIFIDEHIVMPNHFHGILCIVRSDLNVGADLRVCPDLTGAVDSGAHAGAPLPEMMQWFKTMTTNAYIRGVKQNKWPAFNKRLWQRNYYEHIIRSEKSLDRIREYIQTNPLQWELDENNPNRMVQAAEGKNVRAPFEHALDDSTLVVNYRKLRGL